MDTAYSAKECAKANSESSDFLVHCLIIGSPKCFALELNEKTTLEYKYQDQRRTITTILPSTYDTYSFNYSLELNIQHI